MDPTTYLENAHQCNGMWQHTQECVDEQISRLMDNLYHKLNKKLDALKNQRNTKRNNIENASKFQSRLINLTNMKFTREQIQTLSLGPNYAIEILYNTVSLNLLSIQQPNYLYINIKEPSINLFILTF